MEEVYERFDLVLARVASGELLSEVCSDPDFPSLNSVHRLLVNDARFFEKYMAAQRLRTLEDLDRLQRTADAGQLVLTRQEVAVDPDSGEEKVTNIYEQEDVQRSKLRVETVKWRAERLFPRVFGQQGRHVDPEVQRPNRALAEAMNRGHLLPSDLSGSPSDSSDDV